MITSAPEPGAPCLRRAGQFLDHEGDDAMRRKGFISLGLIAASILAVTCVAAASAKPNASGQSVVKVMMIGYPDKDSTDPVTGAKVPGIGQLQSAFEKANPSINLQIINIPWGSGATSYSAKTDAMISCAAQIA